MAASGRKKFANRPPRFLEGFADLALALFVVGSEKLWSMIAAVTSRLCCRLFHPCRLGFSTRDSQQPQHSPGCSERERKGTSGRKFRGGSGGCCIPSQDKAGNCEFFGIF